MDQHVKLNHWMHHFKMKIILWHVLYGLKNANNGCIKCWKMEYLHIILPRRGFSVELFVIKRLFNPCSNVMLLGLKHFIRMKIRSLPIANESVIKYNFDLHTRVVNGHLNQRLDFQKHRSEHRFRYSLICCRWDLGYPGLLPLMLLLPHLPQC
jgi:hypothetical protein